MYYQLIISILHSKRQKSDYVDSVQIRKGNNLTYLTFDYIKNYQIVFEQECFNRTQNVTNKSYQMIFQRGRGETTSIKGCDCHHLLLFYKNQQKCSLSYCFPTFYISRKADSNTDFWSLLSEMVKYILFHQCPVKTRRLLNKLLILKSLRTFYSVFDLILYLCTHI